ncbi:hypothetical protein FXW00_03885 [Staphylococcus pseudintermedius]|nr:hypothetical protein [Staphylococcus pseudintermedius]
MNMRMLFLKMELMMKSTPTELQKELRKRGVRGFVVNVSHNRVTMLVDRRDVKRNKECMRCLTSTETRK